MQLDQTVFYYKYLYNCFLNGALFTERTVNELLLYVWAHKQFVISIITSLIFGY